MKNLLTITLILFTLLFSLNFTVKANHISGADITWECVGQDSFLIRLHFYRDCAGINVPGQVNLNISGCANSILTLLLSNANGVEVSQICPAWIDSSSCNVGSFPGYKRYVYEAIAVLQPCASWRFSYSLNARGLNNNLLAQTTLYIDAEMNSQFDNCNNSPKFTTQEVPYVCVNQTTSLEFGVEEADCDSLYFSMISARSAQATNNAYVVPYSATTPIGASFVLDPYTGKMIFTPTQVGKFIVVIKCEEFDRTTQTLKGYVIKETTLFADICDNNLPSDTSGYITNFSTTGGQQVGLYKVELCQGASMSFDICIYDPDLGDSISLVTNVQTALPGATWSFTGGNPACATINWTATQGVCPNKSFFITANDNYCPIMGVQTFAYVMNVLPTTYAGPDQTICRGDSALLEVFGGTVFNWTAITGDTINVGVNFSCDTCSSAWASPDSTTTYVITTDVGGFCNDVDTIVITVVDTPQPPGSISGLVTVGQLTTETYSVTFETGIDYTWTVTAGGTITSGQGTNTIDIYWDSIATNAQICVGKTVTGSNCSSSKVCLDVNIVSALGIDATNVNKGFMIYPNPTTGQFTVQGATGTIEVYDLLGNRVPITDPSHTSTGSVSAMQIDMSHQPKGIYVVSVGEAVKKLILH